MAEKPRFSSIGTRSDRLHGRTEAIDRGVHAVGHSAAVEIDGDRFARPEPLDALDILQRPLGGKVSA